MVSGNYETFTQTIFYKSMIFPAFCETIHQLCRKKERERERESVQKAAVISCAQEKKKI